MNKERRKQIAEATALIERGLEILETCRDEEQEYYDNMPESFQNGDKGQSATAAVDVLETAIDQIREGIDGVANA